MKHKIKILLSLIIVCTFFTSCSIKQEENDIEKGQYASDIVESFNVEEYSYPTSDIEIKINQDDEKIKKIYLDSNLYEVCFYENKILCQDQEKVFICNIDTEEVKNIGEIKYNVRSGDNALVGEDLFTVVNYDEKNILYRINLEDETITKVNSKKNTNWWVKLCNIENKMFLNCIKKDKPHLISIDYNPKYKSIKKDKMISYDKYVLCLAEDGKYLYVVDYSVNDDETLNTFVSKFDENLSLLETYDISSFYKNKSLIHTFGVFGDYFYLIDSNSNTLFFKFEDKEVKLLFAKNEFAITNSSSKDGRYIYGFERITNDLYKFDKTDETLYKIDIDLDNENTYIRGINITDDKFVIIKSNKQDIHKDNAFYFLPLEYIQNN